MAKNKPTKQHFVPVCYLREFVDPNTPQGYEPYVWIFNKGERKGRNKAPVNILTGTDLYTIQLKTGEKDYSIEETLSSLEGKYANIFRSKIKKHLPLNEEEHIFLCAFVSVMLQRTLRYKDNLERFCNELIERAEILEKTNGISDKKSEELKRYRDNIHKTGVIRLMPDITELLVKMSMAFLYAEEGVKFVTSDDPCNLFNPDLQWQKFYGPGLKQKNVQVTLPLSSRIMLCMSWSNLRGYIKWRKSRVEEANRMTVGRCYRHFISSGPKAKRLWFRSYPMDFFFILKILKHQALIRWHKLKSSRRFHYVKRK